MYNNLDATHELLFPEYLSTNSKIANNISIGKIPGRAEHGINLEKRKIQR
jgi:hypothetical protein|tara:strand:+ start:242 stop:391 length:150 start_codon:yes stop_codon:yes gene_type:complete